MCRRIRAVPPVARQEFGDQAQTRRQFLPEHRELPGLAHQHAIARRQRIDQGRLPGPGAGGRIDHYVRIGLEYFLETCETRFAQRGKIGAAVIHGGKIDRPQDPVRHVGRTRNLEEMAAGVVFHGDLAFAFKTERTGCSKGVQHCINRAIFCIMNANLVVCKQGRSNGND